MKRAAILIFCVAFALQCRAAAAQALAAGTEAPTGYQLNVVGGYFGMGLAALVGDNGDDEPRFAGGWGLYYDRYLTSMVALEAGLGMIGKGSRGDDRDDDDGYTRWKVLYLEIPLGVKLDIQNFQIGVAFVMNIGLSAKLKNRHDEYKSDDLWDDYRRFNIGPKIRLGYAIPIGPIYLVPSIDWSMHLINEIDLEHSNDKLRSMNLMFNAGVEFGF
jgi:hypothetical protein